MANKDSEYEKLGKLLEEGCKENKFMPEKLK